MTKPDMVGLGVAIIEDGRIAFVKGYGTTTANGTEPVGAHTVFRWASLSKGVAATMVAELANDGQIDLEAPVSRYSTQLKLPGGGEQVATVDDVLSQRVGVVRNAFDDKLELLAAQPPAVVSFTFGLPPRAAVERLHAAGAEVWVTVTSPEEALSAAELGSDALVVQGVEAGGHRGVFSDDDDASDLTLLAALQLVRASVRLPLVATGAITTGAAVGAVLVAGAAAAQVGTAYLRSDEAGTSEAQRVATATNTRTVLTRAFSGRTARGIDNRLHREHAVYAPRAYPEIHYVTSPLRAYARRTGDPDLINLWAGQAHALAEARPAGEITRTLAAEARDAVRAAAERLG